MSDREIKEALERGDLVIKEFDEKQVNPASYDARLGDQTFKTRPERGLVRSSSKGVIIIEVGEFAILTTHEHFKIPNNMAGQIGLRSHYARKGLILLSGPQIDPGFKGMLVLGVYNVGPKDIAIPYLEPICTIEFHRLNVPATQPYKGEYQDQIAIPTKDIEFFAEAKGATLAEVIQSVSTLSASVKSLEATVNGLKTTVWAIPLVTTIAVSIAVGVLTLIL
jgi:dCTP deaminase